MKRFLYSVAIGLIPVLIVITVFYSIKSSSLLDVVERVLPAVVMIARPDGIVGAGVIIDTEKGLILSSKHIFVKQDNYTVLTGGGQKYPIVQSFPASAKDASIVRIVPDDAFRALPRAPLATMQRNLKPGDTALSFGAIPLTRSIAISQGIISGLRQTLPNYEGEFIQTDINIQDGFSGGPVFDRSGRVIGINTAVIGNNSVSWATPITQDIVDNMLSQIP